ncbi:hypothetical protein TTHERM_000128777 (macronuclear) [Tetrahymena thermophila SB210]|uniref:Uncharacterized protein n=1 Tax=Tetrahymena thermophila (strain SB210) TaxID=312017 RepID=W7XAG0_TETTS|nr:hypothetical protein TTHERM_000128777 [Tetrahymena thermophila SB210]EWS74317.1 hypothetical protein TTHERM_000128777 [Tetrahymena thermophila SB210]|eukprot:XP_012653138.1 hypothetical protein TTHERM_000128777 [Tetrahymena thermophila SB210]
MKIIMGKLYKNIQDQIRKLKCQKIQFQNLVESALQLLWKKQQAFLQQNEFQMFIFFEKKTKQQKCQKICSCIRAQLKKRVNLFLQLLIKLDTLVEFVEGKQSLEINNNQQIMNGETFKYIQAENLNERLDILFGIKQIEQNDEYIIKIHCQINRDISKKQQLDTDREYQKGVQKCMKQLIKR